MLDPSKYPQGLTNTQKTTGNQEMLRDGERVFAMEKHTN